MRYMFQTDVSSNNFTDIVYGMLLCDAFILRWTSLKLLSLVVKIIKHRRTLWN